MALRVNLATLKTSTPSAWAAASKRVSARVIDGNLWVTEARGEDNVSWPWLSQNSWLPGAGRWRNLKAPQYLSNEFSKSW
jgi:hypothetical protein